MKNSGIIFFVPLVINLVGLALSIFYGMFGGSGGDTTEGVFKGVMITGWSTIILFILLSVRRFKEMRSMRNLIVNLTALTCAILELNSVGWIPQNW